MRQHTMSHDTDRLTVKDAHALIGKHGSLRIIACDLHVNVRIEDIRTTFGRVDYCVTPDSGSGSAWVTADRVTLAP